MLDHWYWEVFLISILVGLFAGIFLYEGLEGREIDDLGSAICEQQYGMDFDKYKWDDGLYCKPKLEENHYDGIIVNIPKSDKLRGK